MAEANQKAKQKMVKIKIGGKDVFGPGGCMRAGETYTVKEAVARHFIDRKEATPA